MPRKKQSPVTDIVHTLGELAIRLGMSPRMVSLYRSLGMPGTPGRYSVEDACVWLVEHRKGVLEREALRYRDMREEAAERRRQKRIARRLRHSEFMARQSDRLGQR